MVLRFRARPAHSLFLGLCSVFKVQCLAILAFVLLPYRVDLYIIPCDPHYVNTFFVTFLTFFVIHVAQYSNEVSCIHALKHLKFFQEISKKVKISTEKRQNLRKFLQKKNRADARIFSLVNSFFFVLIPFYFTSIGSLISFCCSPLLSSITKTSSALPVSQSALNNSIG